MQWYTDTVTTWPILTAMIQFAVLGTLGDLISYWIINKKADLPYKSHVMIYKMAEWALLAVCIKYAFTGFGGFVDALVSHGMLPEPDSFLRALYKSVFMNLQFGPFLVIMHRILDNLIAGEKSWKNLDKGMYSLLWFWIPAHTITFILPRPYQIGLAAVWSVALGVILGFYKRK